MQWLLSLSTRARMQVLVLVTVTPIIALSLWNSLDRRRFGEAEVRRDTITMATRLAENMENQVVAIENLLRGVALKSREHDFGGDSANSYLEEIRAQMPQISNLAIVDLAGTVRYSAERGYRQLNVADRAWFKQVVASRAFVTSGYLVGSVSGKELVVFASPLLAPDRTVTGVVLAALSLDKLNRLFIREAPPAGYEVFLVDGDGTVLCTTADSSLRIGRPVPDAALRDAILAHRQDSLMVADDEGIERIFFFKGVAGTAPAYSIGIGMPTAVILGPINELLTRSLILVALITVFSLYISHFFGSQLIAQPIEALVGTAARIAAGDLTTRTGLPVHDSELGRLAVALDEMAAALDERERCRLVMADSLRRSEEKYRLLFDTMPNGFALCEVVLDDAGALRDCLFKEVNPAYERISGFDRAQVVGRTFRELLPETAADWLARFGEKVMSGALQKFTGFCPELGKYFEVFVHMSLPGHLAVIFSDVTDTVTTGEALKWKARVDGALANVYRPLIAAGSTLEAMAGTILHQAQLLTESAMGYVSVVDPATGQVRALASVGYGPEGKTLADISFAPAADGSYAGLRGHALNTGKGFYTNDPFRHEASAGVPLGHPPLRRLLSTPVNLAHGPAGQILLANASHDFSARDLEAIERLADLFALVIQRRWAEERVQRYQAQLKALAAETFLIQERERRHLAGMLHDQIGQSLALAMITSDRLGAAVTTGEQFVRIKEIKGLLTETIAATRSLTIEISPPVLYQLGLDAALDSLVETFRSRYGLPVECAENEVPPGLSEESRLMLYHAVRELLMNVLKHAQAQSVTVAARTEGAMLMVVVADDGRGMGEVPRRDATHKPSSYGLFSIHERLDCLGGSMQVETAPGQGTTVTLAVPLPPNCAKDPGRPDDPAGRGEDQVVAASLG